MEFISALDNISKQIIKYRKLRIAYHNGAALNDILKEISATLFYLEKERAKYHDKFQSRIHELILEGSTVSRAENVAHTEIKEMYQLRRVMDSGYVVIDSIRSNLAWLKNERQQSN